MSRVLEPTDLALRRVRRFLLVRRASVALVLVVIALAPGLHALGIIDTEVRGAPWSVSIFGLEVLDPLAAVSLLAARAWSLKLLIAALPALLLVVLL